MESQQVWMARAQGSLFHNLFSHTDLSVDRFDYLFGPVGPIVPRNISEIDRLHVRCGFRFFFEYTSCIIGSNRIYRSPCILGQLYCQLYIGSK